MDSGAVPDTSTKNRFCDRRAKKTVKARKIAVNIKDKVYATAVQYPLYKGAKTAVIQSLKHIYGGETGSTRIIKTFSCIRHGTAVIGLKNTNANDNFAPVAKAA